MIPFSVIGGFLGAGKTTLLNHWLRQAQGRRVAVLVNDFGALNIDAALVAARDGDTIALSNGCVCCSIGDDLSLALLRVMETRPAFDAVAVEASGVSDPWRIAQIGLADPGLMLDGVIVLVDAASALSHAADPLLADSLERPLVHADLIVINQVDRVDTAQLAAVHDWVRRHAGRARVVEATQGVVPMALLSSLALPRAASALHCAGCGLALAGGQAHLHAADHGGQFDTWSWRPEGLFSRAALLEVLQHLPAGVLRLKGLVRSDAHGWSEVQFAGRQGSVRRAALPPEDGAALVAIALRGRLDGEALAAVLGRALTD